jgi:protein-tyrosine phosphatase
MAIVPRPRGGDWLEDELLGWKQAGIDVAVSLLTRDEMAEMNLLDEEERARSQGMQFVSYPITDRGVPSSKESVTILVNDIVDALAAGKNVAIHCRQGIGRAPLIAAGVLIALGSRVDEAIKQIAEARGCPVPETSEQRRWLEDFARARTSNIDRHAAASQNLFADSTVPGPSTP